MIAPTPAPGAAADGAAHGARPDYRGPERRRPVVPEPPRAEIWPWLAGFLFVGLLLLGAGAYTWRNETRKLHDQAYTRLETIGGAKVRELQAWQRRHVIDVTRLARDAAASGALDAPGQRDAVYGLERRLDFERAYGGYADAWILDDRGAVVAARARSGQQPGDSALQWRDATGQREGVVGPVRADATGALYVDSVAEIRDARGRALGYAQLRCAVAADLGPLVAYWPGPATEGAAVLVQRDTRNALLLAGAPGGPGQAAVAWVDLARGDVVAVRALRGEGARLQGLDYTGRPALASALQVPGSPWWVVARLDRSQVDALAAERARSLVATVGLLLLVSALVTAGLYRRDQARLLARWGQQASTSAAFIRGVLDSITEHLAVLDAQGRIIAVNDAWRAFGRANGAPAEASTGVGANYLDVCLAPTPTPTVAPTVAPAVAPAAVDRAPPAAADRAGPDGAEVARGIRDVLEGRRPDYTVEYPCNSPDEPRWFVLRVSPLAGGLGGAVVLHENITARKLAQLEAGAHAERMAQVVAALPAAIYTCDADGTLTMYNEAAARLWGRRPAPGADRWRGALRVFDLDGREVAAQDGPMATALRSGHAVGGREYTMARPDGSSRVVESSAVPFVDARGRVVGGLNLLLDLTERRATELALRRSLAEKEALLKEVHHRVKNNLQVVSSLLRLEAQRVDAPQVAHTLRSVQDRVRAMALLHESLYRSDDLAAVDLPRYLHELLVRLLRAHAVEGARLQLQFEAEPASLPLDQAVPCGLIVNELASNALRHALGAGSAGTLRLVLRALPAAGGLVLQLADDGPGLPADLAARRAGSLGLQLVDDLAHQLGATLQVRSGAATALGRGTEFELRLPGPGQAAGAAPPTPAATAADPAQAAA